MSQMTDFHRQAMDLAMRGFLACDEEDRTESRDLFRQALRLEMQAIRQLQGPVQPTHAVLHRSAGWMAYHAGDIDQAIDLANTGLSNDPPDDLRCELAQLLEMAQDGSALSSATRR